MKIAPARIEAFIKNPAAETKFFLLYGPDAGLVSERAKALAKVWLGEEGAKDPMQTTVMEYDRVKEDPSLLADELNAFSFFGGKKLVKVTDVGASIPEPIQALLKGDVANVAIFLAGELPPASSLRKTCEASPFAAAIPCYREEARDVAQFTRNFLREGGYEIQSDAIQVIQQAFYGDHLLLKRELEKLMLYCGDSKSITLDDVQQSISGMVDLSLSDVCMEVASGRIAKAEKQVETLLQEGLPVVAILRAMLNYFMRLYEARAELEDGKSEQQVVSGMRPPIFFKHQPVFTGHLRRWGHKKLIQALASLHKAEAECKKTGAADTLLLSRVMLRLGKMA